LTEGGLGTVPNTRIMMLVPHDPDDDPRVSWVIDLCTAQRPTEVYASTWSTNKVARTYAGRLYVERVNINEQASAAARLIALLLNGLVVLGPTVRYIAREGQSPVRRTATGYLDSLRSRLSWILGMIDHQVGAAFRFVSALAYYNLIVSTLYQRARAASLRPALVVCHDIFALVSAVMLKQIWNCRVLYDSHEFWGDADMIAQTWEKRFATWFERRWIRKADVVITVSPPLARHLEKVYGIRNVISCPNAEPLPARSAARTADVQLPLKFLLQGQAGPRRGIDSALDAWDQVDAKNAVLFVRCPENAYVTKLREAHRVAIQRGSIVFLDAVTEKQLVDAAAFADLGIIPYAPTSLSHTFACPNKLSQYMQAGLAILSSRLEYITKVLNEYDCGVTYDATDPQSLLAAITYLCSNLDKVAAMRANALKAAQDDFNWSVQSRHYANAIASLAGGAVGA